MKCWKCEKAISERPVRLAFRAQCQHCGADLHVCVNCRYYAIGKPNDCAVPGTERISNREAMNFCEEFALRTASSEGPSEDAKTKAKRMLGLE